MIFQDYRPYVLCAFPLEQHFLSVPVVFEKCIQWLRNAVDGALITTCVIIAVKIAIEKAGYWQFEHRMADSHQQFDGKESMVPHNLSQNKSSVNLYHI